MRAGHRLHGNARTNRRAHQPVAGIGDQRRAGIGNKGEPCPRLQARHQLGNARRLIVLVQRGRAGGNAVMGQQPRRHTRVFAQNEIGTPQHF